MSSSRICLFCAALSDAAKAGRERWNCRKVCAGTGCLDAHGAAAGQPCEAGRMDVDAMLLQRASPKLDGRVARDSALLDTPSMTLQIRWGGGFANKNKGEWGEQQDDK